MHKLRPVPHQRFTFLKRLFSLVLLSAVTACAPAVRQAPPPSAAASPASAVEVQILAINDFHGALEPPKVAIATKAPDGSDVEVPVGGVAYLAGAARALRAGQAHTVTVSAGDTIGATPLPSALFLDEPAIDALDLVGVEYNAVGNHEFDRVRRSSGGCRPEDARSMRAGSPAVCSRSTARASGCLRPMC